MPLMSLIVCLSIQFLLTYYFAIAQVRLDSHFLWIERALILIFNSNLIVSYTLFSSGVYPFLDLESLILISGTMATVSVYCMYCWYECWVKHKIMVQYGYIKIYHPLRK